MNRATSLSAAERFRGCLLGGAIGDALGAPVEFMAREEILRRFGAGGIRDFVPAYGVNGAITDDTQMTLFTAEGLLRAHVRGCLRGISTYVGVTGHAYLRWLETQGYRAPLDVSRDGWLWDIDALHQRRAPGNTCISALGAMRHFGSAARNDSKGCGGVMRVAPIGLYMWRVPDQEDISRRTFDLGARLAGLTHGHPSGQWAAGIFALLVLRLLDGVSLSDALAEARIILRTKERHQETLAAMDAAESMAASGRRPSAELVEELGGGWVAEEALAIALYCALVAESVEEGIVLAVNHGGDSDSTGAIAGSLLGVIHGEQALPERWRHSVELADVVLQMADDLHRFPEWKIDESESSDEGRSICERYPGG